MNGGRVMQAGTPSELYHRPANRFVAGFVGSPAMNLIEGRLTRAGSTLRFSAGSAVIELPASSLRGDGASGTARGSAIAAREPAAAAAPLEDGSAVLGVRPEHLALGSMNSPCVVARVEAVEFLGDRAEVLVASALGRLVVRTASSKAPREGSETSVALDADAVHFFRTGAEGERL